MASTVKSRSNAAEYLLSIDYESHYGAHSDKVFIQHENLHATIKSLPAAISNDFESYSGDTSNTDIKTCDYIKGRLFNDDKQLQIVLVALSDFIRHPGHNIYIEPRLGRFYPASLFNSKKLTTNNRMLPLRVIDLMHEDMLVNTSHALCNYNTTVTLERLDSPLAATLLPARQVPDFLTGPGMQLRYLDKATAFFDDDPFLRANESSDSDFYSKPRHVNHLDEVAQTQLKSIYSTLIPAGCEILDLMSSINSHIDGNLEINKITGLGLNREELVANPLLDEIVIHDINQNHQLPFDDASFDLVVCNLSIEYITQPLNMFDEVARILRPGGRFIISFSNRWFPDKAIKIWNYLHDFERIGLVMEYFIDSARFESINTCSLRGIPRPVNDKYNMPLSDPVYVVWANRE